jgi:hypothetical protein
MTHSVLKIVEHEGLPHIKELVFVSPLDVTKEGALELSIKKWETIVKLHEEGEGPFIEGGVYTCALCQVYFSEECTRCPVREKTGHPYCKDTPYQKYDITDLYDRDSLLQFAKEELEFLKSLKETKMEVKLFEVRDHNTFTVCVGIRLGSWDEVERYLLGRAGYGRDEKTQTEYVLFACILPDYHKIHYDPHQWGDRTFMQAHNYILHNWNSLASGDVVDVAYILGEREKVESERIDGFFIDL